MLKLVIVDDEPHCLASMEEKLKLMDEVIILASCNNGPDAIKAIELYKPDALILDISMPNMDGFTMLHKLGTIDFEIIFATAHNEYAIKAIRMSAFDFLLKPVGMRDLEECMARLAEKIKHKIRYDEREQQIKQLLHLFHHPGSTDPKITLPTQNGLLFIPIKDIVRTEAESNYTFFYLSNGKKQVVARTMKEFEDILCHYNFFRVHKSHIINLNFVSRYIKGDGGTLVLTDGTEIEVAASKKLALLHKLQELP